MNRRTAVDALHYGMVALLTIIFAALPLAIMSGGSGWLSLPMIGVGIAALQVSNWWLPILRRLLKPDLPTVDAVEWKNGAGRCKWQPATSDGTREWLKEVPDMPGFPTYFVPVWEHPENANDLNPCLYRSRLHAKLTARRREQRKAANTWKEA